MANLEGQLPLNSKGVFVLLRLRAKCPISFSSISLAISNFLNDGAVAESTLQILQQVPQQRVDR